MDKRLLDILVCPVTKGKLYKQNDELWSRQAAVMLEEEARTLSHEELAELDK
jgi:uncharacterized protein YbaR (Trm112 family)